ncbi:hypothetical protein B0H13DRAFT_2670567 [Mycena leptocephala]|nr:hypothetical protein B0H13DRAFT_2670567 [Mycena leptocephala]
MPVVLLCRHVSILPQRRLMVDAIGMPASSSSNTPTGSASWACGCRAEASHAHSHHGHHHGNPLSLKLKRRSTSDVLLSDVGVALWLLGLGAAVWVYGWRPVAVVYVQPYLWVNHWLVLITLLHHTDPLLPHYRAPQHAFPRGALATLDRSLLDDAGVCGLERLMGWVSVWYGGRYWTKDQWSSVGIHAHVCPLTPAIVWATCGISEKHVLHHIYNEIPHIIWREAADALRARVRWEGGAGGWAEMYRVFRECKFVEDTGDVVFYKNAHGRAKVRAVFRDGEGAGSASDSGVEMGDVGGKDTNAGLVGKDE